MDRPALQEGRQLAHPVAPLLAVLLTLAFACAPHANQARSASSAASSNTDGQASGTSPVQAAPQSTSPSSSPAPSPRPPSARGPSETPVAPSPSTGCTASAPPAGTAGGNTRRGGDTPSKGFTIAAGEGTISAGGHQAPYLVTLPPDYDPQHPAPLVFAFHGRTRSHTSMHGGDASQFSDEVGSHAIVAYVKSVGAGWDDRSLPIFEALYDRLLAGLCVDTERVFAAGHSSGAHFVHRLACQYPERLLGIAAVAGGLEQPECTGRTAALLIHGERDAVVSISRGRHALSRVLARNGCTTGSAPLGIEGCKGYLGCDPGMSVAWCEHAEPTYQNTNHGWPSFASAAIARFFSSLHRTPLPTGTNLLAATRDASKPNAWQLQIAEAARGSMERKGTAACVQLDKAGENPWDVQLGHGGLTLNGGQRYRIDLRLRASAPTKVRLRLGLDAPPWGEMWVQTLDVRAQPRRVSDEFMLVEKEAGSMSFALQLGGGLARDEPVEVCIDRAWLSEL